MMLGCLYFGLKIEKFLVFTFFIETNLNCNTRYDFVIKLYFYKKKPQIPMNKVHAWISAARLRTLPLSIAGILASSAVAVKTQAFTLPILILALLATLGFQILSNFANDYGDGIKGTDNKDRVGPKRAFQSGLLTAKELKKGMILTSIITLFLASLLIFTAFGNDHMILSFIFFNLGIAAIIAAVKYTVGDNAYGYKALGDVFVFLFFGIVGVVGCYFLFAKSLGDHVFFLAIAIGCMSTAVLNLNNMRDRIEDEKVQKNTLAVVLGAKNVKIYHSFLICTALLAALVYLFASQAKPLYYLSLFAFIPLLINMIKVFKNKNPAALDPELKIIALSTFVFALLLFVTSFF
ncbi:MAG: 1,4-dihydroxy-2-naphthoate octaprenyltransferase [Candidatus Paceibacteria bacterium]|jgi:1,4-dihydroxy-2-naphthoate octaprenyltransferase